MNIALVGEVILIDFEITSINTVKLPPLRKHMQVAEFTQEYGQNTDSIKKIKHSSAYLIAFF